MYKGKSIISIIPARGGSKGLPGKNIKNLCGKPLIGWAIDSAQKSQYIDTIFVSTDSQEIALVAEQFGVKVPCLRPEELATCTTPMVNVVEHVLDYHSKELSKTYDYIVLLEVTSPLREPEQIDEMLKELIDQDPVYDSIISIGEVKEHPSILKKISNGFLVPAIEEFKPVTRRQDAKVIYFPFGLAYITKTSAFLEEKSLYTKRAKGFHIKPYQNKEIDDIYDFLAVESIMKYEWGIK